MISFNDTKTAFELKNNTELKRAYYLFKMIHNSNLSKIGGMLIRVALKMKLPIERLIKISVFNHFCGGITKGDCQKNIDKMMTKNVHSILDYSIEGKEKEEEFDKAMKITLKIMDYAKEHKGIPFVVFKPTGFGRFKLYQKITEEKKLTENEKKEWNRVIERFDTVCKCAYKKDIPVMIDAEETWMQTAADALIEQMMRKYNTQKAIVYNTLQMYRTDKLDYMKELYKRSKKDNFFIGMKVVRGAYMEKERARAKRKNYSSPINATKELSDQQYNKCIEFILTHIDRLSIFAGTHNEESSLKLIDLMQEKGIIPSDKRVWFGQLYGMSDHISFNLAKYGYNVAKYMPFGPVKDVMPYLIRRAEENTSVSGQTSRELTLLMQERKRRKMEKV